jgi:hypothetical protein
VCNFLSDTTFISSLAGAGFGAGLAFWLSAKREECKITQKNIEYERIYECSIGHDISLNYRFGFCSIGSDIQS